MSQHAHRTKVGPPWAAIIATGAMAPALFALAIWTQTGQATPQAMVGTVAVVILMVLVVFRTVFMCADRRLARDRAVRAAERQARDAAHSATLAAQRAARYRWADVEDDPMATQPVPPAEPFQDVLPCTEADTQIIPSVAGLRSLAVPLVREDVREVQRAGRELRGEPDPADTVTVVDLAGRPLSTYPLTRGPAATDSWVDEDVRPAETRGIDRT
jgi:hypothetical protein